MQTAIPICLFGRLVCCVCVLWSITARVSAYPTLTPHAFQPLVAIIAVTATDTSSLPADSSANPVPTSTTTTTLPLPNKPFPSSPAVSQKSSAVEDTLDTIANGAGCLAGIASGFGLFSAVYGVVFNEKTYTRGGLTAMGIGFLVTGIESLFHVQVGCM